MKSFYERGKTNLRYASFWLEMAEKADNRLSNVRYINADEHLFWTKTELYNEMNRFIRLLVFSLERYNTAIEKAKS